MVLILGGRNDVIRMTPVSELQTQVEQSLQLARQLADTVIIMPAGNVGNCPFFFVPFSWLMTRRSRRLHGIARRAAASSGAIYVNGTRTGTSTRLCRRPVASTRRTDCTRCYLFDSCQSFIYKVYSPKILEYCSPPVAAAPA
ncbi:MAG: family lipase [Polaromonas sp.]|nr:family lipase [Polaromonas sp.]